MIREIYRLRLVIFLAVIAMLMAMIRFRYRNYQWPEVQTMTPTPTMVQITPTPTASQLGGQATSAPQTEAIYPLVELLPYKGTGFIVDSYSAPLTLNVVTSGNIKTVTKEVYKWMIKNKVATESHKLIFETGN